MKYLLMLILAVAVPLSVQAETDSAAIDLIGNYVNGKAVMPAPRATAQTVGALTVTGSATLPGGTITTNGIDVGTVIADTRFVLEAPATVTLTNGQAITLSGASILVSPTAAVSTNALTAPARGGILAALVNVSTNSVVIPATTLNVATTVGTTEMILLYSSGTSTWHRVN